MKKRVSDWLFPLMVSVFLAVGFVFYVVGQIGQHTKADSAAAPDSPDWSAVYPMSASDPSAQQKSSSLLGRIRNTVYSVEDTVRECYGTMTDYSSIPCFPAIFELGTAASRCLTYGSEYLSSDYLVMRDGYISAALAGPLEDEVLASNANVLANINDYTKSRDIPFLYVQVPDKLHPAETLPYGLSKNGNLNYDRYLADLAERNIPTLDLRDFFPDDLSEYHSCFFMTDHHWTPETGLRSASIVGQTLNTDLGFDLDLSLLDAGAYRLQTYSAAMFGSQGNAVGRFVSKPEDFSYPVPLFETQLQTEHADSGILLTGNFEEAFVDTQMLAKMSESGGGYAYGSFFKGDGLTRITNLLNPDGKRILVLKDSFSFTLIPYLALTASQIDMLDYRPSNGSFNGNLCAYIDAFKPDLVLMIGQSPSWAANILLDPTYDRQ